MATRRGRTQAYATGNKVYGAGRPMPTIGPVDKSGYRERDAKQMIWKNALARRMGSRPQPISDVPPQKVGGVTPLPQIHNDSDRFGGRVGSVPRTATGRPGGVAPTIGGGANGSGLGQGGIVTPSVKPLTSLPSGALAAQANQGMNGLPYDPSYEGVRRAIEAKRSAANAGINQQRTQMDIEANTQKREIDQQAPEILKELLEGFAGRGMAFSGRYATDVGEQQNQFAAAKSRIDQMLTGNRSALEAEMAKFEAGLQSELSEAEYEYARSLAERAGDLGIATPEAPPVEGGFEPLPPEQMQEPVPLPQIVNEVPPVEAPRAPIAAPAAPTSPWRSPRQNRPVADYQSPAPAPTAPAAPLDLASRPGGVRSMTSFASATDRQKLANGGTVTGGNGYVYKYDPNTSRVVRVR